MWYLKNNVIALAGILVVLWCRPLAVTAQVERLPVPQNVTAMRGVASGSCCAVFVTPRNVFVAARLSSSWQRCAIAPFQRDIELIRLHEDTIDVLVTYGTMDQPRRAIVRSTNAGARWNVLHQLDPGIAEVIVIHNESVVCRDRSIVSECRVAVIHHTTGAVQTFLTPFPPDAMLKGASNDVEVLVGAVMRERPLGILRIANVWQAEQWMQLDSMKTARRPYAVVALKPTTAILVPSGLLIPELFGDRGIALPSEIDADMCIEPEQIAWFDGELVMTYRGRLYTWAGGSTWVTDGSRSGAVELALASDTLIVSIAGGYPTMAVHGEHGIVRDSIGSGITDASTVGLWQAGEYVWVSEHATVQGGTQRKSLLRWRPQSQNRYDDVPVDWNELPRVVGYGSVNDPSLTWIATSRLQSLREDSRRLIDEGGVTGAGGEIALVAGAGQDADIAVSTYRVLRRPPEEAAWSVVGMMRQFPFADAVLAGDTVWALSIDPGLTSDDNVLFATVFVGDREVAALQEVHRGRDRSVYRWSCAMPGGVLVHVGNGLRLSQDLGRTWLPVPVPAQEMVRPVLKDGRFWSAGLVSGQPVLLWSVNGVLWNVIATDLPVDAIPSAVGLGDSHVVLATSTGVYQVPAVYVSAGMLRDEIPARDCGPVTNIVDATGRSIEKSWFNGPLPPQVLSGVYVLQFKDCPSTVVLVHDGMIHALQNVQPRHVLPE